MDKNFLKEKKWYTLIELLIVVAIISIIFSIAWSVITSFISYQKISSNAYILYQSVKDVQTNVSNSKYYAGQVRFQVWQPLISPAQISYFIDKKDMSNPISSITKNEYFNDEKISIWKIRIKTLNNNLTRTVWSVLVVYEGTNLRLYNDLDEELESVEIFVYYKNKDTKFVVKMDKYHILPIIEKWD